MSFSDVVAAARNGRLERVNIRSSHIDVTLRGDATKYQAAVGDQTDIVRTLQDNGAEVGGNNPNGVEVTFDEPSTLVPWVFWGAIWIGSMVIFGVVIYFAFLFALRRSARDRPQ